MHAATLRSLQLELERFYALEETPDITQFVRVSSEATRETVLLRQDGEHLELAVVLPTAIEGQAPTAYATDLSLQLVEAVSHFVYIAERARTGLPTTQLELELQAEVDKFVMLALGDAPLERPRARALHVDLYERVRYLHPENTEAGARYRLANDLAARFVARLMLGEDVRTHRGALCRFYRSGQAEKIRLARAA
jgi:hypothetical protein